jgi:RecB family exonuclease
MPRASVEGERALAERVWARLRCSTKELLASYPAAGDREEENSPSPSLVEDAVADDATAHERSPWWLASAVASRNLEERPRDMASPALVRRGGSSILQHQSDCAFRAFASKRLGADKLDAIQPQPDAARRGTLVHAALEKAYRDIPGSVDLDGLSEENIAAVARDAADDAIRKNSDFFVDAADLENATRLWLAEMVSAWMSYERSERQEPWQIENVESAMKCEFPASAAEPLTISYRPDRIDRVSGDALVILDFKTSGTPKTSARWKGERPAEPQLPLYLALLESPTVRVDGIAFANLSARDKCELRGVAATEISKGFKPPKDSYSETTASWKQALEVLALAYLAGEVRVDPRDASVCSQCASHALCRVTETGLPDDEDGGEEAE